MTLEWYRQWQEGYLLFEYINTWRRYCEEEEAFFLREGHNR
jgi:hypothetical protein